MKRKSIQWRLSISYAGIAFLAALFLGMIMLVTLRQYYVSKERDYLTENAISISQIVVNMQRGNASADIIEHTLGGFSFFSNSRIMLFDSEDEILFDTGSPQRRTYFFLDSYTENGFLPEGTGFLLGASAELVEITQGEDLNLPGDVIVVEESGGGFPGWMIANSIESPLGVNSVIPPDIRSRQVVEYPILGEEGMQSGTLKLSEGPAYGRDILRNVTWGWGISAFFATLIAAIGGWFVSRQFSSPLESLSQVTASMAAGDLSARSEIKSPDEFGQLANSFNLMADSVEVKVTALRRFVADAAHQLGTPLTALRTNLELIDDDHVQVVLDQVQRMDELTGSLLALSKLEAADSQLESVDAAIILKGLSELFASQADQAEVELEFEILGDEHVVWGDSNQIEILMENLIDNAIKFTPTGGDVLVRLQTEENGVAFTVADTGIGILEEDLHTLFSRFHRGRNAAGFSGSGLGLAIVKAIVENHDGEIKVMSRSEGSEFEVKFPGTIGG